jgi:hypothetical protein
MAGFDDTKAFHTEGHKGSNGDEALLCQNTLLSSRASVESVDPPSPCVYSGRWFEQFIWLIAEVDG